jgi:hypothetical protein
MPDMPADLSNGRLLGALPDPAEGLDRPRLGTILVGERVISEPQLAAGLEAQAELQAYAPLGQILLDQKAVSPRQLASVLDGPWIPGERDIILINQKAPIEDLRQSARATTVFMGEDARDKLRRGLTTLEEVERALPAGVLRMRS